MANDFGMKRPPAPAVPKPNTPQGTKVSWPAWYYGPNPGEKRLCNGPDAVPDGWATSPYNAQQLAREARKEKGDEGRMSREDIIADLKAMDVRFDWNKPTGELWSLLRDLREHAASKDAAKIAEANGVEEPISKVATSPRDKFSPFKGGETTDRKGPGKQPPGRI